MNPQLVLHPVRLCAAAAALSLAATTSATAQTTGAKPVVGPDDYGKWEQLGRATMDRAGEWVVYQVRKVDGDSELRILKVGAESPRVIPWGTGGVFSADGMWAAWSVGVSKDERERLEKAGEPVRSTAALLRLGTDDERSFEEVQRFSFDETGRFLALLAYAPKEPAGAGASLQVLDLEQGTQLGLGNVTHYSWSEVSSLLAVTIGTGGDTGNGIQVLDARSGRLRGMHFSGSKYRSLTWRKEADDLAVLRTLEDAGEEGAAHTALAWRGLAGDQVEAFQLDLTLVEEGLEVVEHGGLRWSDEGGKLAFGLRPVQEDPDEEDSDPDGGEGEEEEEEDEGEDRPPVELPEDTPGEQTEEDSPVVEKTDLPSLQIWHTSDVEIFPGQKLREERDKQRTFLCVWHLQDERVVRIGTDLDDNCELIGGWQFALERDRGPYVWGRKFGRPYHDLHSINVSSGVRYKTFARVRYSYASPGGRYVIAFDGKHYQGLDLDTGFKKNLTSSLDAVFANTLYDTPTDLLPPHGVGGWLEEDAAVLLYDQFDVWQVALDGSGGTRLTHGAESSIVHRVVDLDPEEDAFDPERALYFSLRGELSEQRGIARLIPGEDAPQVLVLDDKLIAGLQKAEDAEVYLYRSEARDDSPDFFVAGPDLSSAEQISHTNPFQEDYAWTHSQLLDFKSEAGLDLQAALLYPADYDPTRRYPMIVYTYEKLAPQIHRYQAPDERRYYNFTVWTQQGYFVLMPDIVYRPREPGLCAIEAVRPAVAKTVEMGLVDAERVGLIGHSWGGYNATYLPTRIDIFAASVAGAPLTDFVSFMGQIHWRGGMPELSHWETGQGRMEVPFWEDPEAHRRSSPIHQVHSLNTPILMAFGDNDGTVDWDQGTEFYNFARRAEKQMVLLVYEGERHGFSKEANQVDYHRRILEWFGHYLKDEPAPAWITDGIPAAEQEKEARRVAERD